MMRPEDTIPSIRRIAANRPDAFGLDLVGQINSADVENMYGLIEASYEGDQKVDILVRMTDCDGFDRGVLLKDTTLALKTPTLKHVRRCAIVGGPAWITGVAALLSPFMTMTIRHFSPEAEADAWKWIDAEPA